MLEREINLILDIHHIPGVPRMKIYGQDTDNVYMVQQLLDKNLEQLKNQKQTMKLQFVFEIGTKLLETLEKVHDRGIIHRDIKPENIMVDLKNIEQVYLIDFGLGKRYLVDGKHIPPSEGKGLVGTARYASIWALKGYEQSRRDDLEALLYTLMYLLKGPLPWFDLRVTGSKSERYKLIQLFKEAFRPNKSWNDMPNALNEFFYYVRSLQFEERPNYNYLIGLLNAGMQSELAQDWNKEACQTMSKSSQLMLKKSETLPPKKSLQYSSESRGGSPMKQSDQLFQMKKSLFAVTAVTASPSPSNNANSSSLNEEGDLEELDDVTIIRKVSVMPALKHPYSSLKIVDQ